MQDLVKRARELARRQRDATYPAEDCFDPKLIDELADALELAQSRVRRDSERSDFEKDQM